MHIIESKGIARVCQADDLEILTLQGWVVTGTYSTQSTALGFDQMPNPNYGNHSHSNSYSETIGLEKHLPVTTQFFLLTKDETTVLEEKETALKLIQGNLKEAKEAQTALGGQIETLQKELTTAQRNAKHELSRSNRISEDLNASIATRNRMETDLGKLRNAFGELAVKKILDVEN